MGQLLSQLVPSQAEIATELESRSDVKPSGRLQHFLDDFGLKHAFFLATGIVFLYLVSCAVETIAFGFDNESRYDSTIAEVVAAFVALFFAVGVFSVQLHAQRGDAGAFLVSYLVRAHCIHFILSLGIGITAANAAITILHDVVPSFRLHAIGWLNFILVPGMIIGSIWLISVTLRDASCTIFKPALPIFRRDMLFALAENIRRNRMTQAIKKACEERGLKYGWPEASIFSRTEKPREARISKSGVLLNIRLDVLEDLGQLLRRISPDLDGYLFLIIGQKDYSLPVLRIVLKKEIPSSGSIHIDGEPCDETLQTKDSVDLLATLDKNIGKVEKLLNNACYCETYVSRTGTESLQDFLSRYGKLLRILATKKEIPQLQEALQHLEEITVDWSQLAPEAPLGSDGGLFSGATDLLDGPLNVGLHDVIRDAIKTNDEDTVDAIVIFLRKLVRSGGRSHSVHLVKEAGGLLLFTYYQLNYRGELSNYCTKKFDSFVYGAMFQFNSLRSSLSTDDISEQAIRDQLNNDRQCLDQVLQMVFGLIRAAIIFDRARDASQFVERLFEHERYVHRSSQGQRYPDEETIETLFQYVRIVLAGWCAKWMENNPENDAAAAILRSLPASRMSQLDLIGVWELYRAGSSHRSPIDEKLGIEDLDPSEPRHDREGVGEGRAVDMHWIDRGLHLLLLHAQPPIGEQAIRYFKSAPPRYTWDESKSRGWLEQMAELKPVDVNSDERTERVESVLSLIRARHAASEAEHLVNAITSDIDKSIWKKFVSAVEVQRQEHDHWIRAIRTVTHGLGASRGTPLRSRYGIRVWRDFFIPGNNWVDGFSSHLGEHLALRESIGVFGIAEDQCLKGQPISHLADIREYIRNCANELKDKGYTPNMIVLPRPDRFACALFDEPLWYIKSKNRDKFGLACIGEWAEFLVLRWPFTDATTVMVADVGALFGEHITTDARLDVKICDFSEQEQNEKVACIQLAVAQKEIPSNDELLVTVEAYLVPQLGIADVNAGITMGLDESDGSYAMLPHDGLYHRVNCPEIENFDDICVRLSKRLEGESEDRKPCPTCEPQKMDREARYK